MIKVLVLEDDMDYFDSIEAVFQKTGYPVEITHAKSRDSALELLDKMQFDFITVDQKVPTQDGGLDADTDHGRAVLESLYDNNIGTPICVLTALSDGSYFRKILKNSSPIDIWGTGDKTSTTDFLPKEDIVDLPKIIGDVFRQINELDDVEINSSDGPEELLWHHRKLIRIFVKRSGGVRCNIRFLSGGLSDSDVVRIDVFDSSGSEIQNAILKIGSRDMVQAEAANFELVKRLAHDAAPSHLVNIEYGAGKFAAIAFQLAKRFDKSLFDLVLDDGEIDQGITKLNALLEPWAQARTERRLSVGDIRRFILTDAKTVGLKGSFDLDWIDDFENREVQAQIGVMHGDLHGENVLVDSEGAAVLIDYGDVNGSGPQLLDWITLEYSMLFHPKMAMGKDAFFEIMYLDEWDDESYCARSMYADYFQKCRVFSAQHKIGEREYVACVYSYVMRQLTYDDTDKELAMALLEKCRLAFNN